MEDVSTKLVPSMRSHPNAIQAITTPTPTLPIPLLGERPDLLQRKPGLPHPFPPEILDLFIEMSEQDLSP